MYNLRKQPRKNTNIINKDPKVVRKVKQVWVPKRTKLGVSKQAWILKLSLFSLCRCVLRPKIQEDGILIVAAQDTYPVIKANLSP